MAINEENKNSKSSFLIKLREILNDPDNSEYIKWSENGFIIYSQNINGFANNILPKYFKHNLFSTFQKQLNLYNFHIVQNEKKDQKHFWHDKFKPGITNNEIKLIKKKKEVNYFQKKMILKI